MMRPGTLVLVATPIGNLGDLSPRAVEALTEVDAIVCEDTRRTGRLLAHFGVPNKRLIVANEHTESNAAITVVGLLTAGGKVAVVTDAGLPGISDPGEWLVRAAIDADATISVVPGPSAADAALVISGLPTARYVMDGFLPRTGSDRKTRIAEVANEPRTVVLYEAPHRLLRTLTDLTAACGGERRVVLVRELTKLHEEVWRGTLSNAIVHATEIEPRGEFVILLEGAPPAQAADDAAIAAAAADALAQGLRGKDAADHVATTLGVPRRQAYEAVLTAKAAPLRVQSSPMDNSTP
jgi:16S rRNA (cytidine1402-2'-O)-methyltransferase